jgi:hypothetical protein
MLVLMITTGVLLAIAGLALLFPGHAGRRLGWIGAVTCLGTFSLMLATRPMMSIAATGLGIAFPLALCILLYLKRSGVATHLTA